MSHIHNALHRTTQLQRGFALAFGLENDQGVERLGETLTPVVDLWREPEWAALRGVLLGARMRSAAAIAGELGFVTLSNPAGSDIIVTVDAVKIRNDGADAAFTVGELADSVAAAEEVSNARGSSRDARIGTVTRAINRIGGSAAGLGLSAAEAFRVTSLVEKFAGIAVPCVLTPGRAIAVECATANLTFSAGFRWTERPLISGELF